MDAMDQSIRHELAKAEFSEGYAEAFLDAYVATQIKVQREQNDWTQADLAREIGTKQTVISRIENANYSAWNIKTLKKLARAYRLRLHVSFETYGSLIDEMERFSRESLQRTPREKDPLLAHEENRVDVHISAGGEVFTGVTELSVPDPEKVSDADHEKRLVVVYRKEVGPPKGQPAVGTAKGTLKPVESATEIEGDTTTDSVEMEGNI